MKPPRVAALVLAAGKSTRMGFNKLLADVHGAPLIRKTVEAVLSWKPEETIVVTGHEAEKIALALDGLNIAIVRNAGYERGLASSLRCGLESLPGSVDAVLVCLGDMPLVEADIVHRLIAAFNPAERRTICVPVYKTIRANPVLWGRAHFSVMAKLSGDRGAKALMDQFAENVVEIETLNDGVVMDADTPEALARLRAMSTP